MASRWREHQARLEGERERGEGRGERGEGRGERGLVSRCMQTHTSDHIMVNVVV